MYFLSINKYRPDADRALVNRTIPLHREGARQQIGGRRVQMSCGAGGDNKSGTRGPL